MLSSRLILFCSLTTNGNRRIMTTLTTTFSQYGHMHDLTFSLTLEDDQILCEAYY